MMIGYEPIEVIVLPEITYMQMMFNSEFRRIYTDGRDFPKEIEPSFAGYSIGKWIDEDGDGHYDVLEVETRSFKGPRIIDRSGIPLHKDNQTVIKERIYRDKADPNVLRDEITVIDHALTRPWTVTRSFHREAKTVWTEHSCGENNDWVFIDRRKLHGRHRRQAGAEPKGPAAAGHAAFRGGEVAHFNCGLRASTGDRMSAPVGGLQLHPMSAVCGPRQ